MPKIDFAFIANFEGGQRYKGYVPDAAGSQSGVTIATGFDLGARNATDLQNLGLPQALIDKLSKYLGKQRSDAERVLLRYPLTISKAEADLIDKASKQSIISSLISLYDGALPRRTGIVKFEQLPTEAQTVITSVAFQYGDLKRRTPNFWKAVTEQRWQAAVDELRDFGDRYSSRRRKEADLLAKVLKPNKAKEPVALPVANYGFALFGVGGLLQEQPSQKLTGSVGKGGKNTVGDVKLIQTLLNSHRPIPALPLPVNGKVDPNLINAIVDFQRRTVGMSSPDGRVDPGGRTLQALTGTKQKQTPTKVPDKKPTIDTKAASSFCFPFPKLPTKRWSTGQRSFGYNRDGGKRKHAACDIYFPAGTWIHAVADGTVIQPPYNFYAGTQALEIQHGDFIVRYGEIKPNSFVGGTTVKKGQRLCQVGHLMGISVESDMLHFEMYAGTATGSLTVKANKPFQRRSDLLDPTPFLDAWAANLPST